jgi:hypothetical protein
MPPQALSLGLFVIEEAIKEEPAIAAAIQDMFNKGIPTAQDWANLRAMVSSGSYGKYVTDSSLPASETGN